MDKVFSTVPGTGSVLSNPSRISSCLLPFDKSSFQPASAHVTTATCGHPDQSPHFIDEKTDSPKLTYCLTRTHWVEDRVVTNPTLLAARPRLLLRLVLWGESSAPSKEKT